VTITTAPLPQRSAQIRDIHALYDVVDSTEGLPMPSTGHGRSSFNFSGVKHAEDAQRAMREAEDVLTRRLGLTFAARDVTPVGSAAYWVRTAWMAGGLAVDLVALAAHKPADGAGAQVPELATVAA
jgi:hypothetical protein